MVEVKLERVSKRFGSVLAVDSASFTAPSGEFLTLVGPSGCGKTTVLRLIAGFEKPDAGDILFSGKSILALPPESRRVGMVFQNYALFPHMSVAENVAYGLRFRRGGDKRGRVRELLALVDLAGLEKRSPAELSAGQRQRAALARTLAPEPQLLLLDEPLSALDAKLRERLRLEIKRLQRQLKITTIYVTHDQEEALAISDRVAVMNSGRVEQLGTAQEVYTRPATEFVASFIGRGNLLSGVIARVRDGEIGVRLGPDGPEIAVAVERLPERLIGEQVRLLVRPELIRLGNSLENKLHGRLRGTEFLGDALWAFLDCPGTELRLKLPPGAAELKEGQEVEVSFSPLDCYLVPPRRGEVGPP